jgi:hypothetical protein
MAYADDSFGLTIIAASLHIHTKLYRHRENEMRLRLTCHGTCKSAHFSFLPIDAGFGR